MRRRFNAALCPTEPPKKSHHYGNNIGSKFNRWFCRKIKAAKITNQEFSDLIDVPYPTVMSWRYKNEPKTIGQIRIAEGLSKLGFGGKQEIYRKIKDIVNESRF